MTPPRKVMLIQEKTFSWRIGDGRSGEHAKGGFSLFTARWTGKIFRWGPVDRWMPHARKARMIFAVDQIGCHECRVRVRSLLLVQHEDGKESPSIHLRSSQVDLLRDQLALGLSAGEVHLKAMESKTELQSNIRLEFNWIDGTLSRLTLLEVPVELSLDASNAVAVQSHATSPAEDAPGGDSPEVEEVPRSFSAYDPFPRLHLARERAGQANNAG
jgi:hypothetical protein